jgi:cytochrome c oxidase assembly protein Cox11
MPLRFVVDPDLPAEVKTLSLSYTFYQAGNIAAGTNQQAGVLEELHDEDQRTAREKRL